MFELILYLITIVLLILSWRRDKGKTRFALRRGYRSFMGILPLMMAIFMIIGFIQAWLTEDDISKLIGAESGLLGVSIAALGGSIVLMPGFVAFPLAASLLETGAGLPQVVAFLTTLMMVGLATLPLEITYFGRRAALVRNICGFLFSLVIAAIMGWVLA
jgi:uncharacterized membrane protein YraQ (UPF0718 family)